MYNYLIDDTYYDIYRQSIGILCFEWSLAGG